MRPHARLVKNACRITFLIFVTLFISCIFLAQPFTPAPAQASTIYSSGECGENATWTLDTDGVLTIQGTGPMTDYDIPEYYADKVDTPWINQVSAIKSIVVEEGITSIGTSSFRRLEKVTTLSLPSTLESICDYAFSCCSNLRNIEFPEHLKTIGNSAFKYCSLNEAVLPQGITTIGASAFAGISNLPDEDPFFLYIPATVIAMGSDAPGKATIFYGGNIFEWNDLVDGKSYKSVHYSKQGIEHDWSEWSVYEEATCVSAGEQERHCNTCGVYEYETLPKNDNHEWDSWKWIDCEEHFKTWLVDESGETIYMGYKPTQYHSGLRYRTCEECEEVQKQAVAAKSLNTQEKTVTKAIEKFLKAAKSYDIKKMNKCFVKKPSGVFFEDKAYMRKIIQKYNKKYYSWQFHSIECKSKTATVKVFVTYMDKYNAFVDAMESAISWGTKHPDKLGKPLVQYVKKQMKKCVKKRKGDMQTMLVTFKMSKTSKGWKIKKAGKGICNSSNCDYELAYDAVFDQ